MKKDKKKKLYLIIVALLYAISVFSYLGAITYFGLNHPTGTSNFDALDIFQAFLYPFLALVYPTYAFFNSLKSSKS